MITVPSPTPALLHGLVDGQRWVEPEVGRDLEPVDHRFNLMLDLAVE